MTKPSPHPSMQNTHPRSLQDLKNMHSSAISFSLVPKPTRRYLKKLSLNYLSCPDCESQEITFYGKSSSGTQKYRCKACEYQFVAQFDAYFPRSKRHELFEREYLENLAATGFRTGAGRKEYWEGALQMTLSLLESDTMRIRVNKMIKSVPIQSEHDHRLLLEFAVHEAYVLVMG